MSDPDNNPPEAPATGEQQSDNQAPVTNEHAASLASDAATAHSSGHLHRHSDGTVHVGGRVRSSHHRHSHHHRSHRSRISEGGMRQLIMFLWAAPTIILVVGGLTWLWGSWNQIPELHNPKLIRTGMRLTLAGGGMLFLMFCRLWLKQFKEYLYEVRHPPLDTSLHDHDDDGFGFSSDSSSRHHHHHHHHHHSGDGSYHHHHHSGDGSHHHHHHHHHDDDGDE